MTKIASFLKSIVPFTVLLFVFHYYGTQAWAGNHKFFYPTWSIYVFLFVSTLLLYIFLLFVRKNYPDFTGFAFLGTTFLKMLAAVVFLIPLIQSKATETNLDIAAFFIPYFLFLFFETFFAIRLINKS